MKHDLGGFFLFFNDWGSKKNSLAPVTQVRNKILFARVYHLKIVIQYVSIQATSMS